MLEFTPHEVRLKALIGVVRNLIRNSRNTEIFKLDEILKENTFIPPSPPQKISKEEIREKIKEEVKEKIKEEVKEKLEKEKEITKEGKLFKEDTFKFREIPRKRKASKVVSKPVKFEVRRVLKIPKVSFPFHLQHIKPVPSGKVSIDLGKLNPLVQDPNVSVLESEGESEPVYVMGAMGRKPTNIRLSKTEINEVINRFSEEAKIPKSEGMFKVAVGKLLLTAMISSSVSSRFVIEKIKPEINHSLNPPGPRY